jgi:hypothetical protein
VTLEERKSILNEFIEMLDFSCSHCKYGPAEQCKRVPGHLRPQSHVCIMSELRLWSNGNRMISEKLDQFLGFIKPE